NGEWWAYHTALAPPPIKNVAWKGTRKVLTVLRNSVQATEPGLRVAALEGLRSARDTNSSGVLREQFDRDPDSNVQRKIVEVLGEFRDERFAPRLATLLREHSATETSLSAVQAAGQIGGRDVISALIDLLGSSSLEIQREAYVAIGQLKANDAIPKLALLSTDHDRSRRIPAQTAIARIGGDAA